MISSSVFTHALCVHLANMLAPPVPINRGMEAKRTCMMRSCAGVDSVDMPRLHGVIMSFPFVVNQH
ncbi:MAG: hypothetical protein BJ554DRAFT_1302 [Olpidium bornovanus]|uniref:Uncharacterized protein n=1 Tax=Olpidium bornovanus TaxID=278681 RepID=A0A8H7ZSI9_9FUNG|nr:MAG: hypothetical protein BJ554DRAFT_1302 [Olpidium bornovanus]